MIDYLFKLSFIVVVSACILFYLFLACFKLYITISNYIKRRQNKIWRDYIINFEKRNNNKVIFSFYDIFFKIRDEVHTNGFAKMSNSCFNECLKHDLWTRELLSKIVIKDDIGNRIITSEGDLVLNDGYWTQKQGL